MLFSKLGSIDIDECEDSRLKHLDTVIFSKIIFVLGILLLLRPTVAPTPTALTMLAPSNVNVTQETLSLGWLTQVSRALG